MSIGDKLRSLGATEQIVIDRKANPLWKGPESNDLLGGITFSMLSRFFVCRERFRCYYMEGLRPVDTFNHKIEYGNMWHMCEENYNRQGVDSKGWVQFLRGYCEQLTKKYPLAKNDIDKWYNVCKTQFNIYIQKWSKREDDNGYTDVAQEKVFDIPYTLPSGRTVRLRGKFDKLLINNSCNLWLKENKSKGDIDEQAIESQLTFDLQTMMYICALVEDKDELGNLLDSLGLWSPDWEIEGVIYNVVRRPLSGGKHTIVQHKPTKSNPSGESTEAYYNRLGGLIEGSPEYFFMRWDCKINEYDIEIFKTECLNPILENLCWWYDSLTGALLKTGKPFPSYALNYRYPYGIYNSLIEGGSTDVDRYLATGDEVGLRRVDTLFEELQCQ